MADRKIDQKEVEELKKIYNHYLDRGKDIMKNTQFRVEDIFGYKISKDYLSPEQITKLNTFFSQNSVTVKFCIEIKLFEPKKKKLLI